MGSFRILPKRGSHTERNSSGEMVTYNSGDVVKSPHDLVELFPEKFALVGGRDRDDVVVQPVIPVPVPPEAPEPVDPPRPDVITDVA